MLSGLALHSGSASEQVLDMYLSNLIRMLADYKKNKGTTFGLTTKKATRKGFKNAAFKPVRTKIACSCLA